MKTFLGRFVDYPRVRDDIAAFSFAWCRCHWRCEFDQSIVSQTIDHRTSTTMADVLLSVLSCFGTFSSFRRDQLTCPSPSAQIPKYHAGDAQMLGISHSGVRLIRRNRAKAANDSLIIIETFPFDIIQQTSPILGGSTMDLRLTKKRITVHSHRVRAVHDDRAYRMALTFRFRSNESNSFSINISKRLEPSSLNSHVHRTT